MSAATLAALPWPPPAAWSATPFTWRVTATRPATSATSPGSSNFAARPQGTGRTQLPGIEVRRSFDWLCFASGRASRGILPCAPPCRDHPSTWHDLAISLELLENSEDYRFPDNVYNGEVGCLDWNRLSGPLEIAELAAGETSYQPVGIPTAKKIKTLFHRTYPGLGASAVAGPDGCGIHRLGSPVWDRRGG